MQKTHVNILTGKTMLSNQDKRLLEEIKDTVRLIEENYDNKNLLKYFIGNLRLLTEKVVKSYLGN